MRERNAFAVNAVGEWLQHKKSSAEKGARMRKMRNHDRLGTYENHHHEINRSSTIFRKQQLQAKKRTNERTVAFERAAGSPRFGHFAICASNVI